VGNGRPHKGDEDEEQIEVSECLLSFGAESFVFQCTIKSLNIKIYRTIIMSVVQYGCETLSLTLREERGLRVFENRVLRGIFGPMWDEVTGEWRKLHNEELYNLYYSPTFIRMIKSRRITWAVYVARMGERRFLYRVLVGSLMERDHL
jgi:hypothetical protein